MFKNFRKETNKNDGAFYEGTGLKLKTTLNNTQLTNTKRIVQLEESWCDDPHKNRAIMKADCVLSARCPFCTMYLPCKHFEKAEAIAESGWFSQQEWDHMPEG